MTQQRARTSPRAVIGFTPKPNLIAGRDGATFADVHPIIELLASMCVT